MTHTAPAGYESFLIPTERVEELQARIAKLNRKAVKLGTPSISLIVTENTDEVTVSVGGSLALRMGTKFTYERTEVLLKGETPKLNGWEFLSVVLHRPAGNEFVTATPDVDLSDYVFAPKGCDHCNINRPRNATFLVKHEDGTIKQVGSSCLEDYTGVKSPQSHATHMENIFTMFHEVRSWGSSAGRTSRKFFLQEWLAFVNMCVRDHGYVGRNKSYDTGQATTAEIAKRLIIQAIDPNTATDLPTNADFVLAAEMIEWVRTEDAHERILAFSPDFGKQLLAACKSNSDDAVSEDTMAIIAPLAPIYARYLKDTAKPTSYHVGAVKGKVNLSVKIERIGQSHNDYGMVTIYNMRDISGNSLVWFSSRDLGMEQGDNVTVTGTVKAHDFDNYNKENRTILTRCKVA